MKIAICLHGKFTGINNRGEIQGFEIPFEYLKKNVITENTDVFLHGWDDDPMETEKLINLVKPKKALLEKQIVFDHPFKHYDFVPHGGWNTKDYLNNNYSRFYSLKRAMELIDDSYDLVMVMRFDCIFYEKFDFSLLEKEKFYLSHWHHNHEGWGFNDAWFVSGWKNMKELSLIYDRLDDWYKLDSEYLRFIKSHGMNETNLQSGHIHWRYRIEEMGLKEMLYGYGIEYETWGLLRRLNQRDNPWGRPVDNINIPSKI